MDITTLDDALTDLASAEEFLDFFGIDHDPRVVQVYRLHILQRFHQYLLQAGDTDMADEERFQLAKALLEKAYLDFVHSTAQKEKVFQVFRKQSGETFVPLEEVFQ